MAKLTLVGKDGKRVVDIHPRPVLAIPEVETDNDIHRRQAFSIVKNLTPKLKKAGLSDKALWTYFLSAHQVCSRKDLTEKDWVVIAARLSAAERDSTLFGFMVKDIKSVITCRAYRIHNDGTFKKVYDGIITEDIEERCQNHADASGCTVRLHGADGEDGIVFFEPTEPVPDPNCPPIAAVNPNKPARVFELHTNGKETQYIEIPFPDTSDLKDWGQQHANETGVDVHITCRMGHNRLMCYQPKIDVTEGVNDVVIDGVKWILLNQWDDKYHWVKLDRTMERYIAAGTDRTEAVAALVEYIKKKKGG